MCARPARAGTVAARKTRTFSSFTSQLEAMADWFTAEGVTEVVMEATGSYWKPVWYVLEERGFELKLVNARHVKILPGRKTDVVDAEWLAELLEHGLLRGSFVPPAAIRELRDLTRYRKRLIQAHTSECQRIQKTLEDAGIKLDSVASDVLGVSGRAMLAALVAGERDPEVLAELAKGVLRKKIPELREALRGRFRDHHALLIRLCLDHTAHLEAAIAELDTQVDRVIAPFVEARDHLDTITGVGKRAAESSSPRSASTWPGSRPPATWRRGPGWPGQQHHRRQTPLRQDQQGRRVARRHPQPVRLGRGPTRDTYLSAQYWRLARRIGKKKAAVAVGHSILVICWHLLTNNADYDDLGGDYFTRRGNTARHQDRLVQQLQDLGYQVTLKNPLPLLFSSGNLAPAFF